MAFFLEAADILGVPKSVAAIYGICFASPQPLGFSEIQARLDISAGSISQGLRVLREIGALKVADFAANRETPIRNSEIPKFRNSGIRLQMSVAVTILSRISNSES